MTVMQTLVVQIDSSVFFFAEFPQFALHFGAQRVSKVVNVSVRRFSGRFWLCCIAKAVSTCARKRHRRHCETSMLEHKSRQCARELGQYTKRCCRIKNSYVDQDQHDKIHNESRPGTTDGVDEDRWTGCVSAWESECDYCVTKTPVTSPRARLGTSTENATHSRRCLTRAWRRHEDAWIAESFFSVKPPPLLQHTKKEIQSRGTPRCGQREHLGCMRNGCAYTSYVSPPHITHTYTPRPRDLLKSFSRSHSLDFTLTPVILRTRKIWVSIEDFATLRCMSRPSSKIAILQPPLINIWKKQTCTNLGSFFKHLKKRSIYLLLDMQTRSRILDESTLHRFSCMHETYIYISIVPYTRQVTHQKVYHYIIRRSMRSAFLSCSDVNETTKGRILFQLFF